MEKNLLLSKFMKLSNILAAISLREDKNMKVYHETGKDLIALINRKKFLNKLGLTENKVVSAKAVHGDNVEIATSEDCGNYIPETDGLITNQKNVYLSVTVADCLPVVIFEPLKEILCLIHCGWMGLEKKIIKKAVEKMTGNFDVNPEDLLAGIGPSIGGCHFEVKEDFLSKFKSYPEAILKKHGKNYVNLKDIAKKQLEAARIKEGNIEISPICTYCHSDKYFSFRKDKSRPVEAMIVIAGMPDRSC